MYVGTQIEPRDDSDYRVWTQLGVTHVCVDPPGSPHYWSLDALRRHKDHVESFGLSLDMVQLPISSGPIEPGDRLHILLAKGAEWQREIDGLCGLIERLAATGISAAKYNLSLLGVPRTERETGAPVRATRPFAGAGPIRKRRPPWRGSCPKTRIGSGSTVSSPQSFR